MSPHGSFRRRAFRAFVILALASTAHAATLINDFFSDGDRTTNALPDSAAWFCTADGPNGTRLSVRNRTLVFTPAGTSPALWTYFPKVDLAVGEFLTVAFGYQFTGTWANIGTLRIGFLNSNGIAPVTTDLPSGPTGAYTGYGSLTQNFVPGPLLTMRRAGPGISDPTSPLITSLGTAPNQIWFLGPNGGVAPPAAPNTTYTAVFMMHRAEQDRMLVSIGYAGAGLPDSNQLTVAYPAPIVTEFDTLVVGTNTGHFSGEIIITGIVVRRDSEPRFITQPASQTVTPGSTVVFEARADGSPPLSYQWRRNGINIAGATAATHVITDAVSSLDGSQYSYEVKNNFGTKISNGATLAVRNVDPAQVGRLSNLSVRTNSGSGAQVLNVGIAIGGAGTSGTKPLLVRVSGPALAGFGVSGTMADPTLTIQPLGSGAVVAANDNWGGDSRVTSVGASVGAFALTNPNSRDAAVVTSLAPGVYTVLAAGANATTGTVLTEIYDGTEAGGFTAATPRLINVSARAQANTGDDVLIAGFAIAGSTSKTVLIRATGPALANFGVPGTLVDPKLELVSSSGVTISESDNWSGSPAVNYATGKVGAFAIADMQSKDAALLVTLPPGGYTAKVTGADGGTGVALIEVYEVP